jgi:tetratricopeptide (TPR) repeat protein
MVLSIRENTLGPEHDDVAYALNTLALLHKSLGDFARAKPLFEKALQIFEKSHGPDHETVGLIQNNLANLYLSSGEYDKAGPLYNSALKIFRKIHGLDHAAIAKTLCNLGMLHYYLGDYGEAEHLFNEALAIGTRSLGPKDPDLARILDDLALLYQTLGDAAQAEPLLKRAQAIRKMYSKESVNLRSLEVASRTSRGDSPDKGKRSSIEQGPVEERETGNSKKGEEQEKKKTVEMDIRAEKTLSYPYSLYLGSFRTSRLEKAMQIYIRKGLLPYWTTVHLTGKGLWHRVFEGHYATKEEAESFMREHQLSEATVKETPYANLIGLYDAPRELEDEIQGLKKLGYFPYVIKTFEGKSLLYVGAFYTKAGAEKHCLELRSKNVPNQVVTR